MEEEVQVKTIESTKFCISHLEGDHFFEFTAPIGVPFKTAIAAAGVIHELLIKKNAEMTILNQLEVQKRAEKELVEVVAEHYEVEDKIEELPQPEETTE